MSYRDTINWVRAHEEASRKAKVVEDTSSKSDGRVRKLIPYIFYFLIN